MNNLIIVGPGNAVTSVADGVDIFDHAKKIGGNVISREEYIAPISEVDALAAIAARRFDAEVAGISVAGVPVYTDRTTQNKLTAAAFRALRNPEYTVDWKCTNGSFITLNAEQITAIADAVGDYVQACYTREGELVAAFNDGSYTDAMLEEGWPA